MTPFTTLCLLTCLLIPTYVIYPTVPRMLYVEDNKIIYLMGQNGYYYNGTRIDLPYPPYFSKKNFFPDVCNFWKNTSDIYYDLIRLVHMEFNYEKNQYDLNIVHACILIKVILASIILCVIGINLHHLSANISVFWFLLSGILLLLSVGSNIMAIGNSHAFGNMVSNGAFDITGYSYNLFNETFRFRSSFYNQQEFLYNVRYDNIYFHFTKCEKINRMDIYNYIDIVGLVGSFVCLIILWFMLWNDRNNQYPENQKLLAE
jgi:hypothetical protein